jgi:hypothetical protein
MTQAFTRRAAAGNAFTASPHRHARIVERRKAWNQRGLSAVSTQTSQVISVSSGAATSVVDATLAPTIASTLGISATAAIPIIGAAIAAIGFGIEAILNSGCGSTCIVTSNWANQAEALLQQNITAYFNLAVPRPLSAQQAALANFNTVWNYLVQQCSNAQLGTAGVNCIQDRQAGACKWHQSASTVPPWGTPPAGACWNWFNGYHDPIANDPDVYDDGGVTTSSNSTSAATSAASTGTLTGALSSVTATTGLSSATLALLAAAVLLLFAAGGSS